MLDVRNLTVSFPTKNLTDKSARSAFSRSENSERVGAFTAVRDFSLAIERGEIVGLVGASGCGKSVFASSLLGLIESPGYVEYGSADFVIGGGSVDLFMLSEREWSKIRGREIAMVFQDSVSALNPTKKISAHFIETICAHEPNEPKQICLSRAEKLLSKMMFPTPSKILGAYPFELSGGMCQRIMIALALAQNPTLLIADEPTTALDSKNQAQILRIFRELRDSFGTSVLIISHDVTVIKSVADKSVEMR